ncbi:uncharacterized protein LOC122506770 [Leptopilina heterotoma]|nr:uncharacterized protein LOC122506770 [Leptopilina heterotoma]
MISQEATSTNGVNGNSFEWNEEWDESLITAVSQRPALYNYLLPVKERSQLKLNDLWNEIHNTLGVSSVNIIKDRWKKLRALYMAEKSERNVYIPSGSAASKKKRDNKNGFQLFEVMKFLNVSKPTRTLSTFSSGSDDDNDVKVEIKQKRKKKLTRNSSVWSTQYYQTLLKSVTSEEKIIAPCPVYSLLPIFKKLKKQKQVHVANLFQQILMEELDNQS